jgi:uncharacterized membrane protein
MADGDGIIAGFGCLIIAIWLAFWGLIIGGGIAALIHFHIF